MDDWNRPGPSRAPQVPRRAWLEEPRPWNGGLRQRNGRLVSTRPVTPRVRVLGGEVTRGVWTPVDLRGVSDPDEQREMLLDAHNEYRHFLRRNGRSEEAGFLSDHEALAERLQERNLDGMLFTYSDPVRMLNQVGKKNRLPERLRTRSWRRADDLRPALRVSGGAPNEHLYQEGAFARGPYGTTIPPFSQDHTTRSMLLNFFGPVYGRDSAQIVRGRQNRYGIPPPAREAPVMTHFIAFAESARSFPGGMMRFPETSLYGGSPFLHYQIRTPDRRVGDFEPHDIIAYGNSLIPSGRGSPRRVRERSNSYSASVLNSDEEPRPYTERWPATIPPLNEYHEQNNRDDWAGAIRPSRRFSVGSPNPRSFEYIQTEIADGRTEAGRRATSRLEERRAAVRNRYIARHAEPEAEGR